MKSPRITVGIWAGAWGTSLVVGATVARASCSDHRAATSACQQTGADRLAAPGKALFFANKAVDEKKAEDGSVSLFDGKTLEGWEGNPKLWSVKDGVITGETTQENPTKGNTFLIWKGGHPANFELHLKLRYHGGNSGVQYRSHRIETKSKDNQWVVGGYQADVGGGKNHNGKLYEERGRGALANVGETVIVHADGKKEVTKTDPKAVEVSSKIANDQWFDYTIIADGNHLIHKINGHTIIDCTDEQKSKAPASGVIAIQIHAGGPMKIEAKDIHLKELKAQ